MSTTPDPAAASTGEQASTGAEADSIPGPRVDGQPTSVEPDSLDDVQWEVAYDRDSVSRFLVEVEAERTRLLAEIAAARGRAARAEAQSAARRAAAQVELGELVLAAQAELAAMEREHQELAAGIRAAARAEATRVLEAARAEAAAIRGATASLSSLVNAGGTSDRVVGGSSFALPSSSARSDAG